MTILQEVVKSLSDKWEKQAKECERIALAIGNYDSAAALLKERDTLRRCIVDLCNNM